MATVNKEPTAIEKLKHKNQVVDLDNLKTALDDSSDKNRNFMIAFLLLEFYLLSTVLGTTDRDLFLPDTLFSVPFTGVNITLIEFYILAPVLIVSFHYNLLFNLQEHTRTLLQWLNHPENNRYLNFNLLHAFMLNTRAKYDTENNQGRPLNYYLLSFVIISVMSIFPLSLLVWILWKFASYQSYGMTFWHLFWVAVDLFLHIFYWLAIQEPTLLNKSFRQKCKHLIQRKLAYCYLILAAVIALIRVVALGATELPLKQPVNPVINFFLPKLDLSNIKMATLTPAALSVLKIEKVPTEENSNLDKQAALTNDLTTDNLAENKNEQPSPSSKSQDLPQKWQKTCRQGISDYVEVSLSSRNLRFANLKGVSICNVNLANADLRGSTLDNAILSGSLSNADLTNVSMQHAKIYPDSDLTGINLNNANLAYAVLNRVDMTLATAINSKFLATQLAYTILVQADLTDATFTRANLLHMNLRSSELLRTRFIESDLIGTDLRFSNSLVTHDQLTQSKIINCIVDRYTVKTLVGFYLNTNCKISPFIRSTSVTQKKVIESIITVTKSSKHPSINLSRYNLDKIPTSLLELSHLTQLNLSHNKLSDGQLTLLANHLPNLEIVDISLNRLTAVPDSIGQLTQLTSLDLSDNRLATVPDSIGLLTQLTSLDLSGNRLTTVPDSIGQLTQLTSLDLSDNRLTAVPDSIGQLTQLTSLDLSDNRLTTVPDSIGQLAQLTRLPLKSNQLTAVPDSVGQLTQLRKLYLSKNSLTAVPDSIGQLTQLTELYLRSNQLTTVPDSIGQLTQLTSLNISSNRLTAVPDSIGQLTQLTSLDLSNNQLTAVPDSIGQLTQLTSLELNFNRLTAVPDSIGQLAQLIRLDLSDNKLSTLPFAVCQLKALIRRKIHCANTSRGNNK